MHDGREVVMPIVRLADNGEEVGAVSEMQLLDTLALMRRGCTGLTREGGSKEALCFARRRMGPVGKLTRRPLYSEFSFDYSELTVKRIWCLFLII